MPSAKGGYDAQLPNIAEATLHLAALLRAAKILQAGGPLIVWSDHRLIEYPRAAGTFRDQDACPSPCPGYLDIGDGGWFGSLCLDGEFGPAVHEQFGRPVRVCEMLGDVDGAHVPDSLADLGFDVERLREIAEDIWRLRNDTGLEELPDQLTALVAAATDLSYIETTSQRAINAGQWDFVEVDQHNAAEAFEVLCEAYLPLAHGEVELLVSRRGTVTDHTQLEQSERRIPALLREAEGLISGARTAVPCREIGPSGAISSEEAPESPETADAHEGRLTATASDVVSALADLGLQRTEHAVRAWARGKRSPPDGLPDFRDHCKKVSGHWRFDLEAIIGSLVLKQQARKQRSGRRADKALVRGERFMHTGKLNAPGRATRTGARTCQSCSERFEPIDCPDCGKRITSHCPDCHINLEHPDLRPGSA